MIGIEYAPNVSQSQFHDACDRVVIDSAGNPCMGHVSFVAGFGTGKTYAGAQQAVKCAFLNPDCLGIVISPSYPLAAMESGAISHVRGILEAAGIGYNYNKSEHRLYIPLSRSTIQFLSSTYPERLVSVTAAWAWCDEPGMYKSEVLNRVITRLREKRAKYRIMFATGTPEGFNQFYNYTVRQPPDNHEHVRGRTLDNADNLAPDYYEQLLKQYDENALQAYVEGKFTNMLTGNVCHAFRRENNIQNAEFDRKADVWLSCDFNVNPMAWSLYQVYSRQDVAQRWPTLRLQERVIVNPVDCTISRRNADTEGAALDVVELLKERGWRGATIRVTGDASGNARSTKSIRSDYDIIEKTLKQGLQANVNMQQRRAAPSLRDSINALNGVLCNGKGEVGFIVDPSNIDLVDDLEQVAYDKYGKPDKAAEVGPNPRGHWFDEARYLVWALRQGQAGVRYQ